MILCICDTIFLYIFFFFFFNDTATTEIYTLSLHDALPICPQASASRGRSHNPTAGRRRIVRREPTLASASRPPAVPTDRKSTRLNSSHSQISYAVFCLKKKKKSHGDIELINTQLDMSYLPV